MGDFQLKITDSFFRESIRKKVLAEAKEFNYTFDDEKELKFDFEDEDTIHNIVQSLAEKKIVNAKEFEINEL